MRRALSAGLLSNRKRPRQLTVAGGPGLVASAFGLDDQLDERLGPVLVAVVGEQFVERPQDVGVAQDMAGALAEVHGQPVVHDGALVAAEGSVLEGGLIPAADMELNRSRFGTGS